MRFNLLCAGGVALALAGCASQTLQNYVGQPVSTVVMERGEPTSSFDMGGGQRAFVWQTTTTQTSPTEISTTVSQDKIWDTWNQTTEINPSETTTMTCAYVVYAKPADNGVEGPAGWLITGFKKPSLDCEGGFN